MTEQLPADKIEADKAITRTPPSAAGEEWRWVAGWEGCYQISSMGRLYSVPRHRVRGGFVAQTRINKNGYPEATLGNGSRRKNVRVHRLVLEAFVGPCPPGREACHRTPHKRDNRLSNLFWGTHQENMSELNARQGIRVTQSKLTPDLVRAIRAERAASARPYREMGPRFGVSGATAHLVCTNKIWRHVA